MLDYLTRAFRDSHPFGVRLDLRPGFAPDPGTAWRLHLARIMLPYRRAEFARRRNTR
jgi:hypothetical protein